jgi:hypothetical protein
MADSPGAGIVPIVGAGLTLVGGLAVAKIAMDMTKELGKQAKGSRRNRRSTGDKRLDYMLGY